MNNLNILIVDDRPENILTLEQLLEEENLEVNIISALSGNEALGKTLDYDFTLILLDVQMPGMDGFETAKLLRGNQKTKDIPIIFVTADNTNEHYIFKGYEKGAVDFLIKPIDPFVLSCKVKVFLELSRRRHELESKTKELNAKVKELEILHIQLEEKNEKLKKISEIDGLTGIFNRRRFDEVLKDEWNRLMRSAQPLSLLIIDIDHFKNYNDTYGHLKGDDCLKLVAVTLNDSLKRYPDIVARFGGEEFSVILPGTDMEGSEKVAESMLENIRKLKIEHSSSPTAPIITISIGVSTAIPTAEYSIQKLLESADKALYLAKNEGRNRTCRN